MVNSKAWAQADKLFWTRLGVPFDKGLLYTWVRLSIEPEGRGGYIDYYIEFMDNEFNCITHVVWHSQPDIGLVPGWKEMVFALFDIGTGHDKRETTYIREVL